MRKVAILILALLALVGAVGAPARAEEVFVGNRPFKGVVAGSGGETYVGAQALAKALGVELKDLEGVWVAGDAAVPTGTPAGSVVIAGKVIPSRLDASGQPLVHLKSAAEALGAVVRVNKQMACIDVNRPVARATPAAPRGAGGEQAATAPTRPIHLNQGKPGSAVNLPRSLVAGVTNIVYFYADW